MLRMKPMVQAMDDLRALSTAMSGGGRVTARMYPMKLGGSAPKVCFRVKSSCESKFNEFGRPV
ncbi:hypothetical protein Pmar_PMAR028264 [Perkinsus marinus ATCC 50983]|uniref:Uncharacterized protein n=1 Tax=Perkinsus marinus (strain ATCC 50983 / TXsc) TaxID=423536 RepID=C5LBE7_PERM5|nr:hypothetical protein Pmar_PMAR028264 [Perkinsus marinus ATCC 50983]EER06075.1 hypothetical protein Pmar_PMAR028264 [Perkinsus marinus ATCC 50983]|eukprot:XP_002774259.1 hypothetical protein Pmar_PMAR028264 [Perkinsus marinus ATCC 50983]